MRLLSRLYYRVLVQAPINRSIFSAGSITGKPRIKELVILPDNDKPDNSADKVARGSMAKRRRNARQKAMQALYQWDFDSSAATVAEIVAQFCELQNMDRVDVDYMSALVEYVADNLSALDANIEDKADRTIEELDPVERAILRVACAELKSRLDIPYRVVVNEAVEIAKSFGADQGHKYVMVLLINWRPELRALEYQRDETGS